MADHADDLIDYDEEDETLQPAIAAAPAGETAAETTEAAEPAGDDAKANKGSYVGVHST
ncbi:hypothetical protein GGH98_003235, partial [Coemansia sp. RSA 454]